MQLEIVPEPVRSEKRGSHMNDSVMDSKMDTRRLVTPWRGWSWHDCYLQDPAGNRYSPEMVKTSLWAFELAHELTGSPLQVYSLRNELRKRVEELRSLSAVPEVVIRWQGIETSIILPIAHNTYYVYLT